MAEQRLLVVDDDPEMLSMMKESLESEGFAVHTAADGPTALSTWRSDAPSLIVLDWMLPGKSGIDVCREIRRSSDVPIIMVTARGEEPDRVLGLELGADDYVTKPFSLRELTARIRTVLRRVDPSQTGAERAARFGPIHIDFEGMLVRCVQTGLEIPLTSTELKLLISVARHPGRVFSRTQLIEVALGEYFEGYERTIDSHISHLRHKLAAACPGSDEMIRTLRGVGYKFAPRESDD